MNSLVVGVDIGGSHITGAVIDVHKRKIIEKTSARELINSNGSLKEIMDGWGKVINYCLQHCSQNSTYIGIAMPGPFDYENGISFIHQQNKYEALYKINVKNALAEKLSIAPGEIKFENDAVCFLKGEVFSGIAKDCNTALGLTLGTGLGSTIYSCKKAIDANYWCLPFKDGTAEDYFSSRWFVKRYEQKKSKQIGNVKELAILYNQDTAVKEIFEEFGENLADFINEITLELKPELVVLGGNISETFNFFYPSLKNRLSQTGLEISIRKSILKETASLIGAASSWL